MRITRNEKYSHWEHESFEHVQNFCAGLPKLDTDEKYTIRTDRNWLKWPGMIPRLKKMVKIRPCSAVDSAQLNLGITDWLCPVNFTFQS